MRERGKRREGEKRQSLSPPNPTYFSRVSPRIQDWVHVCGFNLIGVERPGHHRPEIILFSMKEGTVGGCLLQEGLKTEESCRGQHSPRAPFRFFPSPSVKSFHPLQKQIHNSDLHAGKKTPRRPHGVPAAPNTGGKDCFFWRGTPNIQEMFLIYRLDCPAVYLQTHTAVFPDVGL